MKKQVLVSMLFAAPFLLQAKPSADSVVKTAPAQKEIVVTADSVAKDSTKHHMFAFVAKPVKNRFAKMALRTKKAKSLVADSLFAKNDTLAPKHEKKISKNKRAKKHQADSIINPISHAKDSIRHERPLDTVAFEGFKHQDDTIAKTKPANIDVKVFPNPTADIVSVSSESKVIKVKVISCTKRTAVIETTDATQVDLTPLEAGMYMIEVTTDGGSKTVSVLKQ